MQSNNEGVQKFSIFREHYKIVATATFDEVVETITRGRFKDNIEHIRILISEGKLDEAKKEKQKLDAFTISGVYEGRRKAENLKSYSRLIILDIDKLDEPKLSGCMRLAQSIAYTYCSFISPSGNGLKIIVTVDSEKENHNVAFNQCANFYEEQLNVKIDRSGSDITRLCYIPFDPELYLNRNSTVFHINEDINNSQGEVRQPVENTDSYRKYLDAVQYTNNVAKFEDGNRNNFIFTLAGNCKDSRISIEEALAFILKDYGYDKREVEATVKSAYKREVNETTKHQAPVFNLDYLGTRKYKANVKIDKRVLFEVFLLKYLRYKKPFYYSRAAIKKDLGINKDRANTIIKELRESGLFDCSVISTRIDDKPRQVTYFEISPKNIFDVVDELMEDGSDFKDRLRPFIESGNKIDIGYGYQE